MLLLALLPPPLLLPVLLFKTIGTQLNIEIYWQASKPMLHFHSNMYIVSTWPTEGSGFLILVMCFQLLIGEAKSLGSLEVAVCHVLITMSCTDRGLNFSETLVHVHAPTRTFLVGLSKWLHICTYNMYTSIYGGISN